MRVVRTAAIAAVLAVAASAGPSAADPAARQAPAGEDHKEIASATAGDFRVVVTADKDDDGSGMPPAEVSVTGFLREDGSWQEIGVVPLEETAFWNTVTGLDGLCEFSVADHPEPTAELRIRFGPSLGCAPMERFHVESGRLVRG